MQKRRERLDGQNGIRPNMNDAVCLEVKNWLHKCPKVQKKV